MTPIRNLIALFLTCTFTACAASAPAPKSPGATSARSDGAPAPFEAKAKTAPKSDGAKKPGADGSNPSKSLPPAKKDARPVLGVDFQVRIGIPDHGWVPHATPAGDALLINESLTAVVFMFWKPYDGEEGLVDIEEIGLKMLESWTEEGAVNEAPVAWKDAKGRQYVQVTGTYTVEGQKRRRRFTFRQLSKKYDFAAVVAGDWPEDADAHLRGVYNRIVDALEVVPMPKVQPVPSDMPMPDMSGTTLN